MNKKGSDYIPLYISLFLVILIGGFIPYLFSSFVSPEDVGENPFVAHVHDFVDDGVGIFGFRLAPFDFLPTGVKNALLRYFQGFSYFPNYLLVPILVFIVVGILYTIIKLLPTT